MRKFLLFLILFVILATAAYIGVSMYPYSSGTRVGSLLKFSKKGFVFKTYEGTVNLEFINTAGGKLVGNTWDFSVKGGNKGLIDSLMNHEQSSIRFHYKQQLNPLPWMGDTKYFVYKVDVLGDRDKRMRNF
ncbi:hypothetical protein OAB01_02230 [Bacteroidia bacterium]|jgi:hypothetical protein|nr:hypothetical protein [Bacteroidia bacterium]